MSKITLYQIFDILVPWSLIGTRNETIYVQSTSSGELILLLSNFLFFGKKLSLAVVVILYGKHIWLLGACWEFGLQHLLTSVVCLCLMMGGRICWGWTAGYRTLRSYCRLWTSWSVPTMAFLGPLLHLGRRVCCQGVLTRRGPRSAGMRRWC